MREEKEHCCNRFEDHKEIPKDEFGDAITVFRIFKGNGQPLLKFFPSCALHFALSPLFGYIPFLVLRGNVYLLLKCWLQVSDKKRSN